jgi:predicted phage terminase large subunit-like protein
MTAKRLDKDLQAAAPKLPPLSRSMLLRMRLDAIDEARHELIPFAKLMRPWPQDDEDPRKSLYLPVKHHYFIASILERVARGELRRVIISAPPRSGKTELTSKLFPAWFAGVFPEKSLILATYNETFSRDFGRAVKDYMQSPAFRQVFPDSKLKRVSTTRIESTAGGVLFFTGVGGSITGRGGHALIIDDPIKNREEADSQLERDKAWTWFTQVFKSRVMDDQSAMMIIATRWHEDDVIGRLTDPENPYYDAEEAATWTVINLPAVALSDDPLERAPGEVLWPARFGKAFLASQERSDPRGYAALYQGSPAAVGGNLFKRESILTYKPQELPRALRIYMAMDLAVTKETELDRSCIGCIGVDADSHIWVLPDVWWQRAESDVLVEQICKMILKHEPLVCWSEKGLIAKSIGPFLRRRMLELHAHTTLDDTHPKADKQTRALSILGRMMQGKVHLPAAAPWLPAATDELLKFPAGRRDDFVDFLSLVGQGLMRLAPASVKAIQPSVRPGTFGYMRAQERRESRLISMTRGRQGW